MTESEFKGQVKAHYRKHGRKLPWRETSEPYRIVVSEIMLQQTQVDRVIPKYLDFIARFPDFNALAKASKPQVLRQWQGLGYNRRGLYLKKIAEIVVKDHGGILPKDPGALSTFPGIGKATAASVAAFAYNIPTPFIETNVRSVYLHSFFPGKSGVRDAELWPFIESTLDRKNPREWYWALMDYGTYLKKNNPNPSRKSAHHTKQPKLKGSLREARGAVLRILGKKRSTEKELIETSGIEDGRIELALGALTKEGFITEKNGIYSLAR